MDLSAIQERGEAFQTSAALAILEGSAFEQPGLSLVRRGSCFLREGRLLYVLGIAGWRPVPLDHLGDYVAPCECVGRHLQIGHGFTLL